VKSFKPLIRFGTGLMITAVLVMAVGAFISVDLVSIGIYVFMAGLAVALVGSLVEAERLRATAPATGSTSEDRISLIVMPSKLLKHVSGGLRCKEILLEKRARGDILAEIAEYKVTEGGRKKNTLSMEELADLGARLEPHTYFDEGDLESVKQVSKILGISAVIHSSSTPPALKRGDLVLIYDKGDGTPLLCIAVE